jgi:hypothetical protein
MKQFIIYVLLSCLCYNGFAQNSPYSREQKETQTQNENRGIGVLRYPQISKEDEVQLDIISNNYNPDGKQYKYKSKCTDYTYDVISNFIKENNTDETVITKGKTKSTEKLNHKHFYNLWYIAGVEDSKNVPKDYLNDKRGSVAALEYSGFGQQIPNENAQRYDFAQVWRKNGSGHSVIFKNWVDDKGNPTTYENAKGIKYRSDNGTESNHGVADKIEYFEKNGKTQIDKNEVYVARLNSSAIPPKDVAKKIVDNMFNDLKNNQPTTANSQNTEGGHFLKTLITSVIIDNTLEIGYYSLVKIRDYKIVIVNKNDFAIVDSGFWTKEFKQVEGVYRFKNQEVKPKPRNEVVPNKKRERRGL